MLSTTRKFFTAIGKKDFAADVAGIAGLACIVGGFWRAWPPLGAIALGVALVGVAAIIIKD